MAACAAPWKMAPQLLLPHRAQWLCKKGLFLKFVSSLGYFCPIALQMRGHHL
jgi:hypothetical protein